MAVSPEELFQKVREREEDGKITCSEARKVAEELGIPYQEVGKVCNELKIKIVACELGCF
jgi:LAO/AO transport system kinase